MIIASKQSADLPLKLSVLVLMQCEMINSKLVKDRLLHMLSQNRHAVQESFVANVVFLEQFVFLC